MYIARITLLHADGREEVVSVVSRQEPFRVRVEGTPATRGVMKSEMTLTVDEADSDADPLTGRLPG
jgi:hypothetical protein